MLSYRVIMGKVNFHMSLKGVKIGTGHQPLMYISESEQLKKQNFGELIWLQNLTLAL